MIRFGAIPDMDQLALMRKLVRPEHAALVKTTNSFALKGREFERQRPGEKPPGYFSILPRLFMNGINMLLGRPAELPEDDGVYPDLERIRKRWIRQIAAGKITVEQTLHSFALLYLPLISALDWTRIKREYEEASDPEGVSYYCANPPGREGVMLVHRQETVDHFVRNTLTQDERDSLNQEQEHPQAVTESGREPEDTSVSRIDWAGVRAAIDRAYESRKAGQQRPDFLF